MDQERTDQEPRLTGEKSSGDDLHSRSVITAQYAENTKPRKARRDWRGIYWHPVFIVSTAAVAAFGVGFTTSNAILSLTNQETVTKGSYILKRDLTGTILRKEAIQTIDALIETGAKLGNNEEETTVWLLQVLTFIQYINLEKNSVDEQGQKISAAEANIRYALKHPSIRVQAQKTLGVLKGLRSALTVQKDLEP